MKIPSYSASELISKTIGEQYGVNKVVKDKTKNQYALINAVNEKLISVGNIILSGHFCIFDKDNNVVDLPEFVYEGLHIKAIILLEADIDINNKNLSQRDNRLFPIDVIKTLINREKAYALRVSSKMSIPIHIYKMNFSDSDIKQVLNFIYML